MSLLKKVISHDEKSKIDVSLICVKTLTNVLVCSLILIESMDQIFLISLFLLKDHLTLLQLHYNANFP